jgi:phage gp45-like
MWLSERMARAETESKSCAGIAEITIGGAAAAAYSDGESRNLPVVSAGGVLWRPAAGQKVLVIECGDGARVVAGAVQAGLPTDLADGEVCVTAASGASIRLKNSGEIIISGNVDVMGTLSVGGVPVALEAV